MQPQKEDRRVKITKRAIKESFIELMQDRPFSKISVKMICDSADINRSTFYAHFIDQYDLLKQIQREVIGNVEDAISDKRFTVQSEITVPVLIQVLEYARSNRSLFRVVLSDEGDSSFKEELMHMVQEKTFEEILEDERLDNRTSKYLELFAVTGCLTIIRTWVEEGCVDEPEMLAEVITKLLFQGVSAFY